MTDPPIPGSGAMFDRVAARYDRLNRLLSFGLDRRWRRALVEALAVAPGGRVLDVATGSAEVALRFARGPTAADVVGLDPSGGMLAVAREKTRRRSPPFRAGAVDFVQGDAQRLPFADRAFDAATIAFGIRNVPDRVAALREMARVVRPGGRVGVLELVEPRGGALGAAARFHVHHVVPRLGGLLAGRAEYRHLQRSIAAFPSPETFAGTMRDAGLIDVETTPLTFGAVWRFVGRVPAVR